MCPFPEDISDEQHAVLEATFARTPAPSAAQMQQLKAENSILQGTPDAHIQTWFCNRREFERLAAENETLVEQNEELREELNKLQEELRALS